MLKALKNVFLWTLPLLCLFQLYLPIKSYNEDVGIPIIKGEDRMTLYSDRHYFIESLPDMMYGYVAILPTRHQEDPIFITLENDCQVFAIMPGVRAQSGWNALGPWEVSKAAGLNEYMLASSHLEAGDQILSMGNSGVATTYFVPEGSIDEAYIRLERKLTIASMLGVPKPSMATLILGFIAYVVLIIGLTKSFSESRSLQK